MALAALATLAAWLAIILSETGWESALALAVSMCRRNLDETLAHGGELGRLSLLIPLGFGIVLALSEAARLLRATRRWTGSLTPAPGPLSKRLLRLARKSGLCGKLVLVDAERPLVFTHGLLGPKVWLSTGLVDLLTDQELEAVLQHEAYHVLARDPLKILAARCLSRALFFAPVARDLCEAYLVSKEVAADEHAMWAMDEVLPLARALRKLIGAQPVTAPEAVLVGQLDLTEARLLALLDPRQPVPLFTPKHLGASMLLLLILLAIAFAPAAGHAPSLAECAPLAQAFSALL